MEPITVDWLRDTEAIAKDQRAVGHDRVMRLLEVARAALQLDGWVHNPTDPEYGLNTWDKHSGALHAALAGEGS